MMSWWKRNRNGTGAENEGGHWRSAHNGLTDFSPVQFAKARSIPDWCIELRSNSSNVWSAIK
jgi:hypothetical protein